MVRLVPNEKLTVENARELLGFFKKKEVPLFEMARVDRDYNNSKSVFGTNGKYAIYVYGNEGEKLPHFHIVDDATKGKKFNMKIRIKDLTIMNIDDKIKRVKKSERRITWEGYSDLRKHLIAFLNTPHTDKSSGTKFKNRYIYIINAWNLENDHPVSKNDMLTKIE